MNCPNCRKAIPTGAECPYCGIVIAKYLARQELMAAQQSPAEPMEPKQKAPPAPEQKRGPIPVPGQAPTPAHEPKRPQPSAQASQRPGLPEPEPQVETKIPAQLKPERGWLFRPVSDGRLISLYSQLGRMTDAGIAATEMFNLLCRHTRGRLSAAMKKIGERLARGETLSQAMEADRVIFPDRVRLLVEVGERTGGLPAIFKELAESIKIRQQMRRKMITSCLYPFFLVTFLLFSLPLSKLFSEGAGAYLKASLLPYSVALLALAILLFGVPFILRVLLGRRNLQSLLRHLPIVGKLHIYRTTMRFSEYFSLALGSGIEVHASLRLAAKATDDLVLVQGIEERVIPRVRQGGTLQEGLEEVGLFHDAFMLAFAAGETSGNLDIALREQAEEVRASYIHRLEILIWILGMAILLAVSAYIVMSIIGEYQRVLTPYKKMLDGIGGSSSSGLEGLLKTISGGRMPGG